MRRIHAIPAATIGLIASTILGSLSGCAPEIASIYGGVVFLGVYGWSWSSETSEDLRVIRRLLEDRSGGNGS